MQKGFYYLDQYKKIKIKNEYYNILGYAELKEGEDFWKKFRIMSEDGSTYWLHVYEAYEKDACKMYAELVPLPGEPLKTIYSDNNFEVISEGKATVIKLSGIKNLHVYDEVFYLDYENEKNLGELLSYEKWNNELNFEYSKGRYVYKGDIAFESGRSAKVSYVELTDSIDMFYEITLGKTLIINNVQYVVSGIMSHKTQHKEWNEYYLRTPLSTEWLYLEKKENSYLTLLGKVASFPIEDLGLEETFFKGRVIELIEKATGEITNIRGDVDVPKELFISYFYQSFTGEFNLMVKQFSKGRRAYMGKFISVRDIVISSKSEVELKPIKHLKLIILFAIFLVLAGIYFVRENIQNDTFAYHMNETYFDNYSANTLLKSKDGKYKYFFTETINRYDAYVRITTTLASKDMEYEVFVYNVDRYNESESDFMIVTKKEVIIIYRDVEPKRIHVFVDKIKAFEDLDTLITCHDAGLIQKAKADLENAR